jgi:transcriptional/translational regulatory protein YebC/TACO1
MPRPATTTFLPANTYRLVGGPDPALNSRLALAIANARKGQLSKTSIEHAIAKGQGKSPSGQALENVTIEAMLPHGVAALIECQTDSKNRTLADIRLIVHRAGGTITPTAFLFEKKGRISFGEQEKVGVDEALEEAIDAGALDITSEENRLVVETPPAAMMDVAQRLQDRLGLRVDKAEVVYVPNEDSMVALSDEQVGEVQTVLDSLEEDPSLQSLYINATSQG